MSKKIRVAAAQFHVGDDVAANLETCLRIIREAGNHEPELLVLPEFSNHCSWYDSAEHCYEVSVDLDGEFLAAIAGAVREIGSYVVINCTVRRDSGRVTGTSIMFSPEGSIVGTTNKQVLIGHENDFLDRAAEAGPVVETPLGRLAMYSCMDGVINETPRCLALRGAQVLCNSLNSFAIDEGSLHIPVRAAENKVWVVAANKTGPLIPEALVGPVSAATSIPAHFLDGAGDSQIVAPDGEVLAMAGKREEVIVADIDPSLADDKLRRDGVDVFAARRPALYSILGADPIGQPLDIDGPDDVSAAAVTTLDGIAEAQRQGAKLICLAGDAVADAADLQALVRDDALIAAATPGGGAMLVSGDAILIEQRPLHVDGGADKVAAVDTQYGRLAVLPGSDIIFPEAVRLAALQSVSTLLVPASLVEDWEGRTGAVERAAENRVNIVLASARPGERGSLIASLQKDFTIMTEWRDREFDGLLSAPEVTRATDGGSVLTGTVHPRAAANKECSRNTHLLASRPWQLLQPMLSD